LQWEKPHYASKQISRFLSVKSRDDM